MRTWSNGNSPSLLVHTLEASRVVFTKLDTLPPYSPAVTLLGSYRKERKTHVHTKLCRWMFTAALFITITVT